MCCQTTALAVLALAQGRDMSVLATFEWRLVMAPWPVHEEIRIGHHTHMSLVDRNDRRLATGREELALMGQWCLDLEA